MKSNLRYNNKAILAVVLLGCFFSPAFSQLTGTKNIPGDYPSIANAVGALNTAGVGTGGVVFKIAAGYTETITGTISILPTGTGTAANPVVFQKDPAGNGANPLITAYTGGNGTPSTSTQDGIWRLVGADYITIDGIDVRDNPANTSNPSTMEYGYALYKASTSNGCQNVTIRNCVISLSIMNNASGTAPMVDGSTGIIVMNALFNAATLPVTPVAGGTNSGNKFYKNTIQNCNTGIGLSGYADVSPFTLADFDNDVGGSDTSTGNTIVNYGGAGAAVNTAAAVRTLAQYGLNVSRNTINNNNGSGTNHPATLRGILIGAATGAGSTITYNTITLNGGGTTQTITGIENASGSTAAGNTVTISNNSIVNSTYNTATTGGFYGIFNNLASPATLVISNNTISNNSSAATTTGFFYGISNSGVAPVVTINNNTCSGNSTAALTTGIFAGIFNSASTPVLSISSNTIAGNVTTSASGIFNAIYNSGSVTTSININSNNIGTSTSPSITFTNANSGNHNFINNTGGSSSASLSIASNNFYTVVYSSPGTGSNTYISNSAASRSQAINGNRFINLNVNTTGNITFISNSVILSATGLQDVNNNSISGSFTKAAVGGTVTLFTSTATSVTGGIVNNNDNNFSNITITGATTMNGWVNTDAGGAAKTIRNNIFSNWVTGTSPANGMNINIIGAGSAITGNAINNISGGGTVTGIGTAAGNDNIFSNTINTLSTTGASVVTGILISSGTTKNIYRNKIYDLSANNAAGTVNGILVSGTTGGVITANIYNNLIGDLRAPVTSATDAIRGISVTSTTASSTINVYYNTIYLNASSSGTNFGSTGVYHTGSATATTASLNLRNNIIVNTSTPAGTGYTVAYRRSSGTALQNYASTSNNNLYFAGTPATNRLLFYDGTNADQTIGTFKTRMATRDAQSVTEDVITVPKFLSTSGSSSLFLHLDPAKATLAESGAVNITGYTDDFDSQIRQGNNGYTGAGSAPDIGADEMEGTQSPALSGTIQVGAGQVYTSLTNAGGLFAGINSLGLSNNLIVKITSDLTEDGTNILNQWAEQGPGTYTLAIQPDASAARVISGNVTTGMIRLNGVTRVVIDGSNSTTGSFLTFRNTNTAGATGTAFTFINGASNNIIRYCNVEAYTNATNGVILFSTSLVTGGNSGNTISNCKINATVSGNTGFLCIYSAGTATAGYANTGNIISNNFIFNYRDRAIDITATGSSAWVISGNSFYNGDVSGNIIYAAAYTLHTIRILGGSGYAVLNNYIGGNAALAGGTAAVYSSAAGLITYQGILLTTTSATPVSNIKGNTIANMSIAAVPTSTSSSGTNVFLGIETNGSGINIGGSLAGEGNTIGSNSVNGSILITTNTAYKSNLRGINCNSSGGIISGNVIGGIDIKNIGTSAGPSTFLGIYTGNAAAPSQISNNIIGSAGTGAVSNSIRVLSTSTSTTTTITGILIGSAVTSTVLVSGNTVQNISYQNTTASGSITGISNTTTATAVITISGNLVNGNTVNASTGGFYGISSNAAPATLTISNNTISGNVSTATTTGFMYGIYTTGASPSMLMNNNTFSGNSTAALTTGGFIGIYNTGTPATLTINSNNFYGNATTSTSGSFYCIYNAGAVTTTININTNLIGTGTSAAITYNAANSGQQYYINNTSGASSAALSISNNIFQNINYAVAGTGNNFYILNSAATLSQAINGNTFTNLNVNTAGNITFISDNVVVSATGTQNVNNNSISGTFSKRVGGSVTLFTSSSASALGSIINNNNNNFSNITVPTTTVIAGWINTDAGSSTKTIQGNTFSNWTGGAGAITALTINLTGTNNSTTGNVISNISSAGPITGITTGAGNDNISSNNINTFSSSGNFAVTGIAVTAGTTKNIYKNKIYALKDSNATGTVNGILVTGGTTVNIFNNLIGDLRAPIANTTTDVIRGININSTLISTNINVYFNTIYLNASSTGTNFSSTCIYHLSSSTATTATLTLRNNSITNTSTPKGSGITVCFRRFDASINNYATTSNNNLVYAGTPGSSRLLFFDGTNSVLTIANYRSLGAPRETASVSEDLTAKFLSTTGSSSVFLHMNASVATAVESGAVNIAGFTDDYDGQIRAGNTGYTGTSSFPDIGADEIFGIENVPPVISYTLLDNTVSTANRNVTGVTITDVSGINTSAGTKPRIYYKRFTDANVWLDNTPSTNGWKYTEAANSVSPFTFTINYALLYGGAAVTAGIIQYFIVAQDIATIANVGINSGVFTSVPVSVALTAAAFPVTGTINSYNIPFSGVYNIGSAEIFTSLTRADGLFASVNSVGLMGATTFNITSDLSEDGANALNQWTESGAGNYTLTLQPDGASLRTVSGNVPAGLIRLNGADRMMINGSNGSASSYLSFKNTNTAGTTGTAFTLLNGAANNTIKYCLVEAFANAVNGVILFSTSSTGGNSNNLIDNCTIHATVASNTGSVAICSAGTVGNENSSNTISNNIIYDYRDRGLDISATGSTGWTISGNSLYNGTVAGTINYAASSALHGIRVLGGSGYSILNNYIGSNDDQASGTNAVYSSTLGNVSYQGIVLSTGSALPESTISGNTIAGISVISVPAAAGSTAFTGIETNGAGINIGGSAPADGNTIGAVTGNGSIIVTTSTTSLANTTAITGINCLSSGGVVNNNRIGGFDITNSGTFPASSVFQGIFINNAGSPTQVNNNLVGSMSTSSSIRVLPASSSTAFSITGIQTGQAVNGSIQVSGNLINNISNLSTTSSGSFTGINNAATLSSAMITISGDTIQYISTGANANAGSSMYAGIVSSSASAINNNLINNITLSSTGVNAQIAGITVSGAYASTVSGNIISNLSTLSRKAISAVETGTPAGAAIIGILNSTTVAGQTISNNRFSGFSETSTAAVNVVVAGIGITSTGSGTIYGNRFGTFTNLATGTAPAICHIMAAGGSFTVYNNTLRISNLTNTNGVKIYGIIHSSSTLWNYFHNTIRVSGNSNGTALRSAAFLLAANNPVFLRNNIFFNIRTGTGTQYAISDLGSPPAGSSTASDYNDFYSSNPNTVGEWGNATGVTFTQWKALSGGDAHSISDAISFILSTYDLEPDSITNCYFNKAGTPITTPVVINTDINNNPRSTVNPDLGAYEFNYTGFTISAGSNTPVCSGDVLELTVDPGDALIPHYSWRNPAGSVISTIQNPSVVLTAGQYKVTVTDSTGCAVTDSTLVSVNPRPTGRITTQSSLCDGGMVILNIAVTGTGTISGTLSNGDDFSGTAPLIRDTILIAGTTSFFITNLSDANCTAIAADIPDTVTVSVTHKGDWLGITSNWNDPLNWCGGILPTSSVDVNIPVGTVIMPVIADSAFCNNITINTGDTLTITGTGILHIAGTLVNYGNYKDNGTTDFNGTTGQQTFSGVTIFNNVTLKNSNGLLLPGSVVVNNLTISAGTLNGNNYNLSVAGNWNNNASLTAFTAGTGSAIFNGTTVQVIGGSFATTFTNLAVSNTVSTVRLNVNASITGSLFVTGGTFDLGAFTANRSVTGGILSVYNNATLKIGGTNTFPVNFAAVNLTVASIVEYSGTNQTVANQTYGNLTLSSSGGAAVKTLPGTSLMVVGNLSSIQGTGTSVSFTAAANITVNGNVSIGVSTAFNGAGYIDSVGGNWVNNGTFNGNTGKVTFKGTGTNISGSGAQNFNSLTVAASGIIFSADTIKLSGNLATTASGSFIQAAGKTLVMSGTGTTVSGSGISIENLVVSGSVTASSTFTLTGNISVSGSFLSSAGTISMSGVSKTISGAGSIVFGILSVPGSYVTVSDFTIGSALIVDGSFSALAGTATFTGTSTLSGTANLFNTTLNGTSLKLSSGSVLGIANVLTVTSGNLDASTAGSNTVNFNGSRAQTVNGITYSNLILSNGNTKTASGAITTNFDITIAAGTTFNPSSYTHSIYGNWINNGSFTAGASTIELLGPPNSFISGATAFNILTIDTYISSTEITLQNNISAATINMVNGILTTQTNIITITTTRTGNGIIIGNIRRTHAFTTGVAYAFEGPNNTVTFSAVSGVTSITVSVAKTATDDFPFNGSVSRVYNISVPAGTYNATLRLHYNDDELNGNNESSMTLWHYSGSAWSSQGKSANDTVANYVEQNGLTDITNRWNLSDDANIVQWNGSVSGDWNTASNWTVLQGSGSRPPSSTDIVDLGTAAFTYQPTITSNVTVKSIFFGSSQAVTLTLGSGGSLTTLGDINGDWSNNATHTIQVNDQSLTVNGDMDLSDGTIGEAINLTIGLGTVTILSSLSESGGANITFSGAGTLNVYENFIYSSGTFTAGTGTVNYNGSQNQHIADVDYYNLVINKTDGIAEIIDTVLVAGNLRVAAGNLDNFSNTTIAGNVTIDSSCTFSNSQVLHVQGNWNNNGTYITHNASIFFDGSGNQAISASTFNNFIIIKPSGTATLTGEVIVTGDFTIASGTFDFQTYSVTRNVMGGTTFISDGATEIIGGNNGPANFATKTISANSTLIYNGVTAQYISLDGVSLGNVIFRNGGSNAKLLITPALIKGNLTIENGATFNGSAFAISLQGNWINNGTFTPSTSNVIFSGIGKTLTGSTTFYRSSITGSYSVLSDLTFNKLLEITSGGSIASYTGISTIVNGDLSNSGILITTGSATFTGNVLQTISLINATTLVNTVNFNGSVSPVLNSTSAVQFNKVNINNTAGINPTVGWTIFDSLAVASGASFNLGISTHNLLGAVTNNGTVTSNGTLNFIPPSAAMVNLGTGFSSKGTVVFGGAGAMTLAGTPVSFNDLVISNSNSAGITPSSDWHIMDDFTLNSGSTLNGSHYTYWIGDDILSSGTINSGTSTFILNGTDLQEISTASAFNNLTVTKAAGTVSLSTDVAVNGILNFISGQILTGIHRLIQPSSGTVTGAAANTGWVNGLLQKNITSAASAKVFEVGDAVTYTPVSVLFSGIISAGDLTVSSVAGDHPNIGSSPVNASRSVNRYWKLFNTGIVFTDYSATFHYVPADIDGGANSASFGVALYNGSSWSLPRTTLPADTSIQATGLKTFGDFAVGEVCYPGTTITYPDSPYCTNAGTALVTRTGSSGGIFSSAAGLSVDAATGAINLLTSAPGSYVIKYTIAANGGCAAYLTQATITIAAGPSAGITYPGYSYCSGAGTAPVTRTGTPGGTYSAAAGLSVDAATGDINLLTSTAGSYTVTYTIAAANGCAIYQVTTPVTITAMPSAAIGYTGSPYCSSSGVSAVTRTGTSGGVYTSSAGLSLDTATGSVNAGASTPGTYTVTYTVAAANGCAVFTTTSSVTISAAPSASISYNGSPFCNVPGAITPSLTGTGGGTYSSTTGLVIDVNSGNINTGTSTPGTYTVTYTIAPEDGCGQFTTTASVAINISGTWSGAVSNNWNTPENWQCNSVPVSTTNVTIPAGLSTYPTLIIGTSAVHDLQIDAGASLTVTGGTLQIGGAIINNGTFDASIGIIVLNGTAAQILPAQTFTNNTIRSFRSNNLAGVTLGGTLNLTGSLTVVNGTLFTGGYLTLKSSVSANARVAAVTSTAAIPVSGNVTVERYVPGQRRYRLITSPVTSNSSSTLVAGQENMSVWGNWQNSGNTAVANNGTLITGGSIAGGYDQQTSSASLYTYDAVRRAYVGFTTANGKNTKYTPLKAGVAYYMFVYGDRTNSIYTSTPDPTIINSTGTLITGDQIYTPLSAIPLSADTGMFTLLGNPFASSINWAVLPRTGLDNTYWGWDPNLSSTGGYITVNTSGAVTLQAPFSGTTGLNQYIQSGQGFFVRTSGPSPQLTIREQDKVANFNGNAFGTPIDANTLPLLAINLQYMSGGNTILADGVLVAFDSSFTNKPGPDDAVKLANNADNIAILNQAVLLSIDTRKMPEHTDTVLLNLSRLSKPRYSLQIFAKQLENTGIHVYLEDRYLNTTQPLLLTDTNNIVFDINAGVPASFDTNRFRIVFHSSVISLPVTYTSIQALQKDNDIQVNWNVAEENGIRKYAVEKSANGVDFYTAGEVTAIGNNRSASYQWLDVHALTGNNFYRIRALQADNRFFLSKTVVVNMGVPEWEIRIFPNPILNRQINILSDNMQKGKYSVQLRNTLGQQLTYLEIVHPGGKLNQVVYIRKVLPSGMYYLEIGDGKKKYRQPVFIE